MTGLEEEQSVEPELTTNGDGLGQGWDEGVEEEDATAVIGEEQGGDESLVDEEYLFAKIKVTNICSKIWERYERKSFFIGKSEERTLQPATRAPSADASSAFSSENEEDTTTTTTTTKAGILRTESNNK